MASTRNNNTPGNYGLQQRQYKDYSQHTLYANGAFGAAYHTQWAGNGLNPGQIPSNKMSSNAADIESFLFGINSTNLVKPAGPLTPEINCLSMANIFETRPVYMPEPLVVDKSQRPFAVPP